MEQNQQNQIPNDAAKFGTTRNATESFRTIPNTSEAFRTVRNDSASFRNVPHPSEKKENHTLTELFGVNYLVSHFSLSIIVMVPLMLGLALGLVFALAGDVAPDSTGVEHGDDDHSLDVLPAQLAGLPDGQSTPPSHRHHGHLAFVHPARARAESLLQRVWPRNLQPKIRQW